MNAYNHGKVAPSKGGRNAVPSNNGKKSVPGGQENNHQRAQKAGRKSGKS